MKLSNNIKKIFKLFQQFNKQIYLVGGCVRDIIMGNTPHDFDFTADATPDEMKKIAASAGIEIIPTGEKYGTLTFHIDGEFYEITTFRVDGNYSAGRRPDEVVFSKNLKDDLCRRDFTFNAMCFAFDEKTNGVKLIDLYNGREDIKKGVVRTIGRAEDRFTEDALRMLRALRFAYRFDFQLSEEVREAIKKLYKLIHNVSAERIREELLQIFSCCKSWDKNRGSMLEILLNEIFGVSLKLSDLNIYTNPTLMLENLKISLRILPENQGLEGILKLSNAQIKRISNVTTCFQLFKEHQKQDSSVLLKQCLDICDKNIEEVQDVIILVTDQLSYYLFDCEELESELERILDGKEPVTVADLAINGDNLLAEGFKGKQVGEALKKCKELVWQFPGKNNKEDLLRFTKQQ